MVEWSKSENPGGYCLKFCIQFSWLGLNNPTIQVVKLFNISKYAN